MHSVNLLMDSMIQNIYINHKTVASTHYHQFGWHLNIRTDYYFEML